MLLLFVSVLVIIIVLVGWGHIVFDFLTRRELPKDDYGVGYFGLLGFFALGLAAITANFFLALSEWFNLAICCVGLFSLLRNGFWLKKRFGKAYKHKTLIFAVVILLMVLGAYAALVLYDTGLYHLQYIKWQHASRIPLGLANLHTRFAYNSVWLSISTLFWLPILGLTGAFSINLVLAMLFFFALLEDDFHPHPNDQHELANIYRFLLILLLAVSAKSFLFHNLGSPSTDMPSAVLTLYIVYLVIYLNDTNPGDKSFLPMVVLFLLLTFLVVTIKLSQLPVLVLPFLFFIKNHWTIKSKLKTPIFIRTLGLIFLFMSVWIIRYLLLSGCVLFPLPYTCFSRLPWSVDVNSVIEEARWIKSWARSPGQKPDDALYNWDWFDGWCERFISDPFIQNIGIFLLITVLGLIILIIFKKITKRTLVPSGSLISGGLTGPFVVLSCVSLGIVFWFSQAPNIRFGYGLLIAFSLLLSAFGCYRAGLGKVIHKLFRPMLIVCGLYMVYILLPGSLKNADSHLFKTWPKIPEINYRERSNWQNHTFYLPTKGDQCWNIPLPCTPYFYKEITSDTIGIWPVYLDGRKNQGDRN